MVAVVISFIYQDRIIMVLCLLEHCYDSINNSTNNFLFFLFSPLLSFTFLASTSHGAFLTADRSHTTPIMYILRILKVFFLSCYTDVLLCIVPHHDYITKIYMTSILKEYTLMYYSSILHDNSNKFS